MEPVTIGPCQLYLGDCREILPSLSGVDACITDPPWGVNHRRGTCADRGKGLTLGTDGIVGDDEPFDPADILRFEKVLIWGANWFASELPPGRWLIWDKQDGGGSGDFSEAEIAWCNKGQAIKFFRHMWLGVQRASEASEPRFHPMQKPVALMSWCIRQLKLSEGECVLDPYMGSGPVGLACVKDGFQFVGIEKDPAHFATACKRIREAVRADRDSLWPAFPKEEAVAC